MQLAMRVFILWWRLPIRVQGGPQSLGDLAQRFGVEVDRVPGQERFGPGSRRGIDVRR